MAQGNAVGGWQSRVSGLAVADGKPSAPDVARLLKILTVQVSCVASSLGFFLNLTESCCMEIFTKCMHIHNK